MAFVVSLVFRSKSVYKTAVLFCLLLSAAPALAAVRDLAGYRADAGLAAAPDGNSFSVTWRGERQTQLPLPFSMDASVPTIALFVQKRNRCMGVSGQRSLYTAGPAASALGPGHRGLDEARQTLRERYSCGR